MTASIRARTADFWAEALGHGVLSPPEGFESWRDFWIDAGEPPDEIGDGYDSPIDPTGQGPRIWFQRVPERKTIKSRVRVQSTGYLAWSHASHVRVPAPTLGV